jgi:hypothetical protein
LESRRAMSRSGRLRILLQLNPPVDPAAARLLDRAVDKDEDQCADGGDRAPRDRQ